MSTTIRLYFDALVAVALMIVVAIVFGFIASAIIGDSPPNFPVAGSAFVVTGLVLFLSLAHLAPATSALLTPTCKNVGELTSPSIPSGKDTR